MSLDAVTGGGTAERIFQISRHLQNQNTENTILTTSIGMTENRIFELHPVKIIILPLVWKRFYVPAPQILKILSAVRGADVVHLMGHWAALNVIVCFAAWMTKKPYVVCPAGALPIVGRSKVLKKIFNFIVGLRMIKRADAHIAITAGELPAFNLYGINSKKVTLLPNAAETSYLTKQNDRLEAFPRFYLLRGKRYLIFLGRLNSIKGPDLLVKAFGEISKIFPDLEIVFAGPDEGLKVEIEQAANELGIAKRIHLIGYVGGDEKQVLIKNSQFMVVPSRQDAMSIVALEAAAQGVPALITDQCGFDEVGLNGGQVVPATVEGLAVGIRELLNENNLVARGRAFHEYAKMKFSWENIASLHIKLFKESLKQFF